MEGAWQISGPEESKGRREPLPKDPKGEAEVLGFGAIAGADTNSARKAEPLATTHSVKSP